MALSDSTRWHFIGIKGAGMAALAELFIGMGNRVTGSDTPEVFYTDAILSRLEIPVMAPFDPANLPVDALRQGGDVANNLGLSAFESALDLFPLVSLRCHVDVFRRHTGLQKPLLNLFGMGAIDTITQRWATFAKAQPC